METESRLGPELTAGRARMGQGARRNRRVACDQCEDLTWKRRSKNG